MIGFLKLSLCVGVYFLVLDTAECQVSVSNLNGAGSFLCGYRTLLQCAIPGYAGGMSWKLDGTLIAQCAFGSCTDLGALPSGDIFTYDETAKTFTLNISITHADNGTQYQCDDSSFQDQTTVNIQVPPSQSAFPMNITETATSITVEAGCFYPSDAGKMDVYCVNGNVEEKVENTITMTPTTTGCTGDCAGPNIFTATGSISINSSNSGGNLKYRFKMYHENATQTQYVISIDSKAVYDCAKPCDCECKFVFLIIVIVVAVGVFILEIVFYPLKKGPSSDKVRLVIAGIAVVICFCLDIGLTIYLFLDCGKCKSECCSKPCPIAGTVVVWILLACDTAFYIFCVVKSTKDVPDPPTDVRHVEALTTTPSIHITWKPGNNGGLPQTFHIKYKKGSSSTWKCIDVTDTGDKIMDFSITDLAEKTQYDIVIYASNEKGNSRESDVYTALTKEQLEWLSCGFCQVEPSCETKHAREPQHSNQPGKDKFARNGNNDKGRENASRTNAAPRPQPAPPMKDPSPLPGITKDKASRGLSATFDDQFDHMPSFESKNKLQPLQPNSITEEDEQKKKKKKKKRKNDETM